MGSALLGHKSKADPYRAIDSICPERASLLNAKGWNSSVVGTLNNVVIIAICENNLIYDNSTTLQVNFFDKVIEPEPCSVVFFRHGQEGEID